MLRVSLLRKMSGSGRPAKTVICEGVTLSLQFHLNRKTIELIKLLDYFVLPKVYSQALSMPTISTIIPVYNRSQPVLRALRSVYAQRSPVDEVIVIDDGSTDETIQCIRSEFPEVIVISQKRQGVSHARNRGIDAAHGNWLAFLDSDDEWLPQKIESQLNALKNHPTGRLFHSDEIWIRNGKRVNPMNKHKKSGGWIFEHCLARCVISPSSVLLHRSLFDKFGNFNESLPVCEDYDLWLRMTATLPVIHIPKLLVKKYGGHEDQLSRSQWGMDRYRIRSLETLLASRQLSNQQTQQVLTALTRKIDIYLTGANRRQRLSEALHYRRKKLFYEGLIRSIIRPEVMTTLNVKF